ncbi:hypothetical protein BGZ97_011047 [Linnemannia gamsii]|jgi:hypothetical protein|uniref:Uncharacterized protein n=1 Tax=Linnemannia gamsii TaxID=64522 RepID=A0A9P6UVV8_9FUNG|nr:hypothetical protein BGZ97_011047 [Linnemannia gamsii]
MDQSISSPTLFTSTLEPSTVPIATLMYDVLSELSCLLELEINDASADFNKILEVAPQLEVLRAPGWLQLTSPDGRLLHRMFTAAHLKEIELFHETDSRAVLSLLRYLSNLESLLLTGGFNQESFQNDYGAAIEAKAAMNNAPNMSLRRLYLRSRGSMDYRILAAILPWVPELREFSCESLHLRMSEILVKNCKHLEVVRELDSFGGDYDPRALPRGVDVVLPLLTGCPTLRVLDTAAHNIQGDIFMNCELACLGLETFRCQIIGMYWLDEANSRVLNRLLSGNSEGDGDDNGSGTGATTSIEEQGLLDEVYRNQERYRRVYRQFSRMTQLRVLELGQEWRTVSRLYDTRIDGEDEYDDIYDEPDNGYYAWYPPPIDGTLDLTLVSGLDQLSTLKELEVFGFEGVDHRMEKVELDWMAAQWPKLKVMRGIHIDIFPKVEPDTKRRELREYMQMLRPDVVHETLFKH